jgi:hypothetical protein
MGCSQLVSTWEYSLALGGAVQQHIMHEAMFLEVENSDTGV